jgi:hypothetical protein
MSYSRISCGELEHQAGISAFKSTVVAELEEHVDSRRRMLEAIKSDQVTSSAFKGVEAVVEHERQRFKATARGRLPLDGARTLSLSARGPLSVSVPPYDVQWTTSFLDDADSKAGTFTALTIDEGYQAAGVGLYVSTATEGQVRFSADATFHSKWTDLVIEHGAAATSGGVGVIVYEGGNVVARTRAQLWDDCVVADKLQGNTGDDVTYLTQTAAGQTYFHMVPNRQYLVWIWAWTRAAMLGANFAGAYIEASIPFVVLARA